MFEGPFSRVMTSELLAVTGENRTASINEVRRRLKAIGFNEEQIQKFIEIEQKIINVFYSKGEKAMAEREYIPEMTVVQINVGCLTISELIAITYEAQNKRTMAESCAYPIASTIYDFGMFKKGIQEVTRRLAEFGVNPKCRKKLIVSDANIVAKAHHAEEAVDVWADPDKYLIERKT